VRADSRGVTLVLGAIVSVQFGAAIAATLIHRIGAGGSVLMRLLFATAIMLIVARPHLRGYDAQAWKRVLAFGAVLGVMNWTFYSSLSHIPIGVSVTLEILGPLVLATVLSSRARDRIAVAAALVGIVLISQATQVPLASLNWLGLGLALAAGACWAGYILASAKVGESFPKLDGLALAMVVSTMVVLPAGVPSISSWTHTDMIKGLGIALLSSVIPYSFELVALRRITPQIFGLLIALEPVVASLAGLLVLDQRLTGTQLVGMAIVVVATAVVIGLGASGDEPKPDLPA